MRGILAIISLLISIGLTAQNSDGYIQFVDFWGGTDNATSVVPFENHYLVIGRGFSSQPGEPCEFKTAVVDKSGEVQSKKRFGKQDTCMIIGLPGAYMKLNDTMVLALGYINDTATDDVDPFFIYFNEYGDTLKTVRWRHAGKWSIPHQGVITSDNKLLITGAYDNATGNDMKTVVYKTDLALNIEWQKFYNAPGYDEGYDVAELPNGNFMIGSGQANKGRLIETDSSGNQFWQKLYGPNGQNCGIDNLNLKEEKIYGSHCLDTVIGSNGHDFEYYVFQSSINGNLKWRLFLSDTNLVTIWNFKAASDTTFLLTGQYMYGGLTSHQPDVGYAAMVDTAGNLVWERTYEPDTIPDLEGRFNDVTVTNDGGFLFVGQATYPASINSDFWIMKTDSLGCLTPGCDTLHTGTASASPAFSDHLLKVYPNPASHQLQIQLELSRPANKITATLYNLQGQAVETISGSGWRLLESMEVKPLSAGMYLLKCTADGKEVATEKVVVE